jgi:hypothetical protein
MMPKMPLRPAAESGGAGGRVRVYRARDEVPGAGLDPLDAVRGRRRLVEALREVERAGSGEQRRQYQQRPRLRRQHGTFHRTLFSETSDMNL